VSLQKVRVLEEGTSDCSPSRFPLASYVIVFTRASNHLLRRSTASALKLERSARLDASAKTAKTLLDRKS
jgi:hypothetical protein